MGGIAPIWAGYPRSYTPGRPRPVQYVVMHYTAGNAGPLAAENGVQYDKTRTDGTSCHIFADSAGAPLQEVPLGDRAHSAYQYGNEIGVHIEICDTVQTRAQWLDAVSYPTLVNAAGTCRWVCDQLGIPLVRLSTQQVYDAYFAPAGQRPKGICDHGAVTLAYGLGDHMDVGAEFPWDVFMGLVIGEEPPLEYRGDEMGLMIVRSGQKPNPERYWVGDGYYHREVDLGTANAIVSTQVAIGNTKFQIVTFADLSVDAAKAIVGPTPYLQAPSGGGGLTFEQAVDAAEEGANRAEDS